MPNYLLLLNLAFLLLTFGTLQAQTDLSENLLAGNWYCNQYNVALDLNQNNTYKFTYPDGTKLDGWYQADLPGIELENSPNIIPIYYTILKLTDKSLKIQTGDDNYPELSFYRKE